MAGIVECVPNFSEGRDTAVVDRIAEAMASVPGVRLLDRGMDAGHNQSAATWRTCAPRSSRACWSWPAKTRPALPTSAPRPFTRAQAPWQSARDRCSSPTTSTGRKRFATVEAAMKEIDGRGEALRSRLFHLVDADSDAYRQYMEARRRVKDGEEGAESDLKEATLRIAQVPLDTARASLNAMEVAVEAALHGNPIARTDALVAALAAHAAVLGAGLNVRANAPSLEPDQRPGEILGEVTRLEARAEELLRQVLVLGREG